MTRRAGCARTPSMRLLSNLLGGFVQNGTLRLTDANGRVHAFGAKRPGPSVAVRLHDPRLHLGLFANPELRAGEAYMDGTLTFEDGSGVGDLMRLFGQNRKGLRGHASQRLFRRGWRALQIGRAHV